MPWAEKYKPIDFAIVTHKGPRDKCFYDEKELIKKLKHKFQILLHLLINSFLKYGLKLAFLHRHEKDNYYHRWMVLLREKYIGKTVSKGIGIYLC